MAKKARSTAPKPFCFVLMPFAKTFDDVYALGIKAACEQAGAYCERVDEQIHEERILDRIYNQIAKADIIVADMSGQNPNVFYEVGYAHALSKLTILVTNNADDIPFDMKHFPHIVYRGSIKSLKNDLAKRVAYYVRNPPRDTGHTHADIEVFVNRVRLGESETTLPILQPQTYLDFTVYNASFDVLEPGDFRIGLLSDDRPLFETDDREPHTVARLSDGKLLTYLLTFERLLPDASVAQRVRVAFFKEFVASYSFVVKLFTTKGSNEFPLTLAAGIEKAK